MRLPLFKLVILACLLSSHVAARPDTIDDFSFTSSSHTISYSLPATITSDILPSPLVQTFTTSAPTTIDGVSGYDVTGIYYLPGLFDELYLFVPAPIFGSSPIGFFGPRFFSFPAQCFPNCPPGKSAITFDPGTYSLLGSSANGFLPYTLTITQEAATTPEPSSLALLATGILGLIGLASVQPGRWLRYRLFGTARHQRLPQIPQDRLPTL